MYWCFSFWLTSLCIIGFSFIHLIRTDSNVFFLMAVFQNGHVNGIMQYVAFWVWLLSSSMMLLRLICVAAYISMCWVVYHHMNIPRFHHTLTGCSIWIVSSLRQLWIELVFTFVYQFLWMYVSSFLLHKYLGGTF